MSDSTVLPPGTLAVTVTVRPAIPSPIKSWSPAVPLSASTDRSTVFESTMVSDAPLTVNPGAAPLMFKASVSDTTLSVLTVKVNVPDPDPAPAAIVTSKDSSPAGIE